MRDEDVLGREPGLSWAKQIDGITIMDPVKGTYYALSETGAFIWAQLERPTPIRGLQKAIAATYRIRPEDVRAEVLTFIEQLVAEGLVRVEKGG